ncbi:hypothetical protein FHS70_000695 [Flammeovirga yaeyamensis]|nr:hypothetical protein [Flammeovirga yaeyamensis]
MPIKTLFKTFLRLFVVFLFTILINQLLFGNTFLNNKTIEFQLHDLFIIFPLNFLFIIQFLSHLFLYSIIRMCYSSRMYNHRIYFMEGLSLLVITTCSFLLYYVIQFHREALHFYQMNDIVSGKVNDFTMIYFMEYFLSIFFLTFLFVFILLLKKQFDIKGRFVS